MNIPPDDPLPTAGIYDGTALPWVAPADYHRSARISRSQLVLLSQKTPAHLRYALAHPAPPTPAMVLGDAIHAALLEPARFAEQYALAPRKWNRTRVAEREAYWSWLIEECGYADGGERLLRDGTPRMEEPVPVDASLTPIAFDDAEIVRAIVSNVESNTDVARILRGARTELSVAWDVDRGDLGVAHLRARPDVAYESGRGPVVADLKSARDGSRTAFRREIANRKLHVQAALYLDGMAAATGDAHEVFVFIIYETEPPYECAVRPIEAEAVEVGRREYEDALATYLRCERDDVWPGYGFEPTGLPPWYAKVGE